MGPVRIEMLGPSGAGKSTVLRAAAGLRGDPPAWLDPAGAEALLGPVPGPVVLGQALDALGDFADGCVRLVAASSMRPSQKVVALSLLRRASWVTSAVEGIDGSEPVVHDELLLHRAFSLLPSAADLDRDAAWFFRTAPVPAAAVVVRADAETVVARTLARGPLPNVYAGLDEAGLRGAVERCLRVADIAEQVLRERGVPLLVLDTSGDADSSAKALHAFACDQAAGGGAVPGTSSEDDLRERLLAASSSFRKKTGRHELRTKDVLYCAFSTPGFSVRREEAQRDAPTRLAHFGLTRADVEGRTVLDLGSYTGAMLFQLSNWAPARGLGIEYDQDKVDLSNEIAERAGIEGIEFRQGDIDHLDAEELGQFDLVLALAIEAHVLEPERLYRLLGQVTRSTLCFEGNSTCDLDAAQRHLRAAGFTEFTDLGPCTDDVRPENNRRPQLLARKPVPRAASPWDRLRRRRP